ncbi:MAG: hypothetical protein JRD88_03255 [Deltaproteobacteria bacterium]|jgi:pyruvate,water dikinase|nr:hypothetical protein [Deltaproteobacteria bacterium]
MNYLIPFCDVVEHTSKNLGGKALTLARLHQSGLSVPNGYCLPISVYHEFLTKTGLSEFINMELGRKDFMEMRWEEIWDASLRIRNHFVTKTWPEPMKTYLLEDLKLVVNKGHHIAVRSSAPSEDTLEQSFAGLHESRVMLTGLESILEAIRIVWSSLWSDGALLYRQELRLDPEQSGMAVILQEMVIGERSGVLFTQAPDDYSQMVVEAVWGLNQALVDGTIQPDRCHIDRRTGHITKQHNIKHTHAMRPSKQGVALSPLSETETGVSPLDSLLADELFQLGRQLENQMGHPVDLEWTKHGQKLYVLQVRPITTNRKQRGEDIRSWYLSLHRSLPNLEHLQQDLEINILPDMAQNAVDMAEIDLDALDDIALSNEITHRRSILAYWLDVYKEKCIPMAHGIRLFGEFYNETIRPDDPYAFIDLLRSEPLLAVERNRQLNKMASIIKDNPKLRNQLAQDEISIKTTELRSLYENFLATYGDMQWVSQNDFDLKDWLIKLADGTSPQNRDQTKTSTLEKAFLGSLREEERELANRLLPVARASYRLRDNDNIYLGKIRSAVQKAEEAARKRLNSQDFNVLQEVLKDATSPKMLFASRQSPTVEKSSGSNRQFARQLIGQPAGPGVASGKARVLNDTAEMKEFQSGEVLVCDAIEPNMTFLVPLATAIVERRGGMLIHGAIIAREYGIPCVTGIYAATEKIHTGDHVTVDGYLGIVTIEHLES